MGGSYVQIVFYFTIYLVLLTDEYEIGNHPCCQEPPENLTLAMIIDAFEIYGHDPSDKLDNLAHYQVEMSKIKKAPDQYVINEHVHIATDHLSRFVNLHIKELKVLLIALDDTIDNMLTMYDSHNAIKNERVATFTASSGGAVPAEFYLSQEFYCGRNVYLFLSELYSDIYDMGQGPSPYCTGRKFHFLGFVHTADDKKYYLEDDPSLAFGMDNFAHGLECHLDLCIYRFPFKKNIQHIRDISTLPKAIVKCGLVVYKLPPLTAASCIISNGVFIFDFNVQGIRYRHYDYILFLTNGRTFYTKEPDTPLACDHHVCEWNYTNFYGGPFLIPGEPDLRPPPALAFMESEDDQTDNKEDNYNTFNMCAFLRLSVAIQCGNAGGVFGTFVSTMGLLDSDDMNGCWFMYPPNYGSIAGISYLDPLSINEYRYSCVAGDRKGLYWYPQWMGAPPHHPYPQADESMKSQFINENAYYPHMPEELIPQVP